MPDEPQVVYFANSDHVRLGRRFLIDIVDATVLLLLWWMVLVVVGIADLARDNSNTLLLIGILAVTVGYLIVLKFQARSLGYLLFDAKVVNLAGHRPSIGSCVVRAIFVFIGPGNTLLDLIWLSSDPHHQAIRDKISRTYVVRKRSLPAGNGHMRMVRLDMFGFQLLLPEVVPESVK